MDCQGPWCPCHICTCPMIMVTSLCVCGGVLFQTSDKSALPPKPAAPLLTSGTGSPASASGGSSDPPSLEELKAQLRDLQAAVEMMKLQHKYGGVDGEPASAPSPVCAVLLRFPRYSTDNKLYFLPPPPLLRVEEKLSS